MNWKDDFWNVKKNAPTLGLGGREAIDLYRKGREKGSDCVMTYEKWSKRAKRLADKLRSFGYPPHEITIRNACWGGGDVEEFIRRHTERDSPSYYKSMYIIDIYCGIPQDTPIGRQLIERDELPQNYWLRMDYNKPIEGCKVKGQPSYTFEVLNYGSKTFSDSDYSGYIIGEAYGNISFQPLNYPTLTDYNDAW